MVKVVPFHIGYRTCLSCLVSSCGEAEFSPTETGPTSPTTQVCWTKYGSFPFRGKHCHEMALRILLANLESHANRYKRHIVPMLSVSVDFYIRVFIRVYTSPAVRSASPPPRPLPCTPVVCLPVWVVACRCVRGRAALRVNHRPRQGRDGLKVRFGEGAVEKRWTLQTTGDCGEVRASNAPTFREDGDSNPNRERAGGTGRMKRHHSRRLERSPPSARRVYSLHSPALASPRSTRCQVL